MQNNTQKSNNPKSNGEIIMFCNECGWEEKNIGLKYDFCPKCGHVNIGFSKK